MGVGAVGGRPSRRITLGTPVEGFAIHRFGLRLTCSRRLPASRLARGDETCGGVALERRMRISGSGFIVVLLRLEALESLQNGLPKL